MGEGGAGGSKNVMVCTCESSVAEVVTTSEATFKMFVLGRVTRSIVRGTMALHDGAQE